MARLVAMNGPAERSGRSRLAWLLWSVSVALAALYLALFILNGATDISGATVELVQSLPFILVGGTIGVLVASRRPENPIGWLLLSMSAVLALQQVLEHYAILAYYTRHEPMPGARWAAWGQAWLLHTFFPILLAVTLMLVPDGHFLSPRWRWLAWIALAVNGIAIVAMALTPGSLEPACCNLPLPVTNPVGVPAFSAAAETSGGGPANSVAAIAITLIGTVVMLPAAVVSLALRRRRGTAELRSQIGLVLITIGVIAVLFLFAVAITIFVSPDASTVLFATAITVVAVGLPISIGVAILRYRLFDVDVVVRKTVVYTTTAVLLILLFLVVAVTVGRLAGKTQVGAIVAAAVIGLSFQPAARLATRIADRVVYGKRATPFEVLAEFSERVAGPQADENVVQRMAGVLGEAVGAERSEVWLHVGREIRVAGKWPESGEQNGPEALPVIGDDLPAVPGAGHVAAVRDGPQLLGALAVAKPRNDPITPSEAKLVDHLASQARLVLRNVRLVEELRASRKRLVSAQDEERRRLERNIHDGAQQQLVALAVKLRLLQGLGDSDPVKARELAVSLQSEAQAALEDLRDLARGIYPPLLADQGLPAALEAQARRSASPVTIEAAGLGRFPRDVEAAVYFCCLEALQNVAKYAGGASAIVQLGVNDGNLTFEVADDGVGFDPANTKHGTGLQGMADRVEAIGGSLAVRSTPGAGTVVSGRVPVESAT